MFGTLMVKQKLGVSMGGRQTSVREQQSCMFRNWLHRAEKSG